MKRFIICMMVLVCMSSSAYADIQEFKYFSLNIPEDWTAKESILDNGTSIVAVLPNDDNIPGAITITAGDPGNLTIQQVAAKYAQEIGNTTPEKPEPDEELYTFEFNNGKSIAIVIGSDSFYMFTAMTVTEEPSESNNIVAGILDSLEMK